MRRVSANSKCLTTAVVVLLALVACSSHEPAPLAASVNDVAQRNLETTDASVLNIEPDEMPNVHDSLPSWVVARPGEAESAKIWRATGKPTQAEIDEASVITSAVTAMPNAPATFTAGLSAPGVWTITLEYGSGITLDDIVEARATSLTPIPDPPLSIEVQYVYQLDVEFSLGA